MLNKKDIRKLSKEEKKKLLKHYIRLEYFAKKLYREMATDFDLSVYDKLIIKDMRYEFARDMETLKQEVNYEDTKN